MLPVGVDLGSGVKTVGTPRVMTQGTLSQTGNDLDVAIRGDGFFKIQMPDGTYHLHPRRLVRAWTPRAASSRRTAISCSPASRFRRTPARSPSITQGQVSVTTPGTTTPSVLGQLTMTRFINKAGLLPIGDNLFVETPASGTPQDGVANVDGMGDLLQGNLEQANVEAVTEISDLISAQRAYEMNAKVISRDRPDAADDRQPDPLRRRLMIRAASLAIILALTVAGWRASDRLASADADANAQARASPYSSEFVRIGDLVDNAGAVANVAIFRAPDIGTTGSVLGRKGARGDPPA